MDGTAVARDRRIQLVGYGPSASTLGASRAGRRAAGNVIAVLRERQSATRQTMPSRRATSWPPTARITSGSPTTTSWSVARDMPT